MEHLLFVRQCNNHTHMRMYNVCPFARLLHISCLTNAEVWVEKEHEGMWTKGWGAGTSVPLQEQTAAWIGRDLQDEGWRKGDLWRVWGAGRDHPTGFGDKEGRTEGDGQKLFIRMGGSLSFSNVRVFISVPAYVSILATSSLSRNYFNIFYLFSILKDFAFQL